MEAYELHRGNLVTYENDTVKFITFIDDKCKKCTIQYPDGTTKTVNCSKLEFIEVDDDFLLHNGFKRHSNSAYADTTFFYCKNTNGPQIIYHTYYDDMCINSIRISEPGNVTIESVGDRSVSHFQNIITLAGHPNVVKVLKIKKSYSIFDDSEEWITFK